MEQAVKILSFYALIFMLLALVFNLKSSLPRIPGDILIDKGGFRIYIPWLSTLIISVILTVYFDFFR